MKIEVVIKKVIDIAYDIDIDELEDSWELLEEVEDDSYRMEEKIISVKEIK